jgi:uncharacterized coiled-coil protein SlyX
MNGETTYYKVLSKNMHTIIDILLGIAFVGFALWMTNLNAQIADVKFQITKLNDQVVENSTNFDQIDRRLNRIEDKLDRAIESR